MGYGGAVGWINGRLFGPILQDIVALSLPVTTRTWTDTGMVLGPTDCLGVQAWGEAIYIQVAQTGYSYPEGAYGTLNLDGHLYGVRTDDSLYNPANVYSSYPLLPNEYVTRDVPAYGLALYIGGDSPPSIGGGQGPGNPLVTPCLRPNRSAAYPASQLHGGGRVWAIFNDNGYDDNSGTFSVTLQSMTCLPQWWEQPLSNLANTLYISFVFSMGYVPGLNLYDYVGQPERATFWDVRPRGWATGRVQNGVLSLYDPATGVELAAGADIAGVDIWLLYEGTQ